MVKALKAIVEDKSIKKFFITCMENDEEICRLMAERGIVGFIPQIECALIKCCLGQDVVKVECDSEGSPCKYRIEQIPPNPLVAMAILRSFGGEAWKGLPASSTKNVLNVNLGDSDVSRITQAAGALLALGARKQVESEVINNS